MLRKRWQIVPDIAGQSDKLMDLFSIGFAVRCL
jgi:hypothetical protein